MTTTTTVAGDLHYQIGGREDVFEFHTRYKEFGNHPRALWDHRVEECFRYVRNYNYTIVNTLLRNNTGHWIYIGGAGDDPAFFVLLDFFVSFPNAKVPFTTRPPESWAKKRWTHVFGNNEDEGGGNGPVPILEPCQMSIRYNLFNFSQQEIAMMYDMTNEVIRCIVPKEQLLEINIWTMNETFRAGLMSSLAKLLEIPVPPGATEWPGLNQHRPVPENFKWDKIEFAS